MHTKSITVGYGKEHKWVATPNPGSHKKREAIPLVLVLRDFLSYAKSAHEVKKILGQGSVLVDKKVRKDPNYGVGLMDVIEFPKIEKYFRVLPAKKGLILKEVNKKESKLKLCKILNKTVVDKDTIQLNLHDGTNLLLKKEDSGSYKTKDTLVLDLPEKTVQSKMELKKGSIGIITKGRHSGKTGEVSEITESTQMRKSVTNIGEIQTLTDYVFVIGEKNKPIITV